MNRNTIYRHLTALRERIASFCQEESPVSGEVEVDESYFGARRVKGLRDRRARGKTIVFGLFKRNGRVYTEIVPDARNPLSKALSEGVLSWKALSILMAGMTMMVLWIPAIKNIFVWNMAIMNLPMSTPISMGLKVSGLMPKLG